MLGDRHETGVPGRHRLERACGPGRDQRVVGVEHEPPPRWRDDRGPAVGDRLQLAVAVELVAEQVGEQHRARLDLLGDLAEPELVDLEQAEVAGELTAALARGAGERRRDPARHVRPGAVVDEARARALEDRRDHRRRRGLAVGGGDHDAAAVQLRRQLPDGVGLDLGQHLARQARAATAARRARERADRLGGGHPCSQADHAGATTRSAPGRTCTVSGRSPIGSPSA